MTGFAPYQPPAGTARHSLHLVHRISTERSLYIVVLLHSTIIIYKLQLYLSAVVYNIVLYNSNTVKRLAARDNGISIYSYII